MAVDGFNFNLPFRIVSQDIVLDSWSTVVEQGKGKGADIYTCTRDRIEQSGIPARIDLENIAPGFLSGIFGGGRRFMAVRGTRNRALASYVFYIHAQDYGANLVVNWWLVSRIGLLNTLVQKTYYHFSDEPQPRPLKIDLDFFEQNVELRAFLSTLHQCVVWAVEKALQELGKNTHGVNSKSGFLGVKGFSTRGQATKNARPKRQPHQRSNKQRRQANPKPGYTTDQRESDSRRRPPHAPHGNVDRHSRRYRG